MGNVLPRPGRVRVPVSPRFCCNYFSVDAERAIVYTVGAGPEKVHSGAEKPNHLTELTEGLASFCDLRSGITYQATRQKPDKGAIRNPDGWSCVPLHRHHGIRGYLNVGDRHWPPASRKVMMGNQDWESYGKGKCCRVRSKLTAPHDSGKTRSELRFPESK